MTICPNSKHACRCQPQEGVMCPYGPTPDDWKTMTNTTNQKDSSAASGELVGEVKKGATGIPYIDWKRDHTLLPVGFKLYGARAPQAATPLPEQDERVLFEMYIGPCDLRQFADGSYVDSGVNKAWGGWQAGRALLTQQAAPEACQWPKDKPFRVLKVGEIGDHTPWQVVMPCGGVLELNHHADDAVDEARAKWIGAALNLPHEDWAPYLKDDETPLARLRREINDNASILALLAKEREVSPVAAPEAPIPMILHCPKCGVQHIDAPDERTEGWVNPPHRSHLCHGCGHIWRPADVPTEGVKAIQTRGKNDSPVATPEAPALDPMLGECAANMNGHRFGPHGINGERQCEWCAAAPVVTPEAPASEQQAAVNQSPIGFLPAYEIARLYSGHDAHLRSAKFGPSALDGDVPVYLQHIYCEACEVDVSKACGEKNCAVESRAPAPSREAAPQVKTWQERYSEARAAGTGPRVPMGLTEMCKDAEIADLRAALAQQGAAQAIDSPQALVANPKA